MSDRAARHLDRELDRLCDRLPSPFRSWSMKLKDGSPWWRVPAGFALILGGIFSFLPVLGIWMLPLGVVLLAKDIPFLRGPSARMLAWSRRKLFSGKWRSSAKHVPLV
jgi:hypothetical protein